MSRLAVLCASMTFALFVVGSVALAAVINGTAGDNTLNGTNSADSIFGNGGNDTITGRGGQDELWGGFDSDTVYGQGNNDTLHGEGGNDALYGGPGFDELRGADGVDIFTGADGDDRLYDRDGNAAERDRFNCGTGNDTVQADPTDRVARTCENVNLTGADLLPDLGMAQLADIQIQNTGTQKQLRFSTTIVNVGAGQFEVTGRRPDTNTSEMTTTQRIFDSVGDYRDRSTAATFIYSGDGHDHWHVKDLEDYDLFQLDAGGNVVEPAVVEAGEQNRILLLRQRQLWLFRARVLPGLRGWKSGCPPGDDGSLEGMGRHLRGEHSRPVPRHNGPGRRALQVARQGRRGLGRRVRPVPGERRDEQLHLGRPADNGGYRDGAAVWAQRPAVRLESTLLL